MLGTKTITLDPALGLAQSTPTISVDLTIPIDIALGSYNVVAQLSAASDVDNNPNNNLSSVISTIAVGLPA